LGKFGFDRPLFDAPQTLNLHGGYYREGLGESRAHDGNQQKNTQTRQGDSFSVHEFPSSVFLFFSFYLVLFQAGA
jgi:hypothetical protein